MSDRELSIPLPAPTRHWFHIPIQAIAAALCIYWCWHTPAPNKAVLCLGGVAALMALVEMRPMHKAIYFVLIIALMFVENRAIDKDRRDFADAENSRRKDENRQFTAIGTNLETNLNQLLADSDLKFKQTLRGFSGVVGLQKQTLQQMVAANKELDQRIANVPLSTLPRNELVEMAKQAALQMRNYYRIYMEAGSEIQNEFDRRRDKLTGHDPDLWSSLAKEQGQKMADVRKQYSLNTGPFIRNADAIRVEILSRLTPTDRSAVENPAENLWFAGGQGSVQEVSDHAYYLERLAKALSSREVRAYD
jgi:hypothetical protein